MVYFTQLQQQLKTKNETHMRFQEAFFAVFISIHYFNMLVFEVMYHHIPAVSVRAFSPTVVAL